jgi:hypothetical protein
MLSDQQIRAKYGQPGDLDNFVVIDLPYPMRIAWDTKAVVKRMQCHKLAGEPFKRVFADLLAHYGLAELQRLGIDLFGGCVNVRKMRGSTTRWSRHAWGIAIDLDPARNGLKTKWPQSQFAKPEYKALMDIFRKHGFINYGEVRGNDTMHWELAS